MTTSAGRPLFVCECGDLGAGVSGAVWTVTPNRSGTRANVSPSVDFPGHFHTPGPAGDVPIVDYSDL